MLCTFCGTENRPEYKFCGSCGVRLERRQLERRTEKSGVSAKCEGCGHVNEPGMKFCGMCGTRVERRMAERRGVSDEARAAAIANAQLPSPETAGRKAARVAAPTAVEEAAPVSPSRRGEPAIFRDEPGRIESVRSESGNGGHISGPSFLGLNAQPASSDNGEYLLEDEPSGGGLRKLIVLLILAAIAALVFMQWRSSFKANPKPAPSKVEPSTPAPGPQGSNAAQPPADAPYSGAAKSTATGAATVTDGATAADANVPKAQPTALETERDSPNATTDDTTDKKPPAEATLPKADTKAPEEAKIPDYKPSPALVRAQQYIRGTGVSQNCEQGLLYLKAATDKSDPGAAIQMAALYSSGLCVKQDRVMAYRWFNSAHELQPANMWIQKNMDQLWAQMSSQERRLAGY